MKRLSLAVFTSVVLSVCIAPLTYADDQIETRVYLNNQCIIADEPVVVEDYDASKSVFLTGIVTSVAQAMINNAVRGVAGMIRNTGRSQDYVYRSEQEFYLYQADFAESPEPKLNPELSCLTVVAGEFAEENAECIADYQPATLEMSAVSADAVRAIREAREAANVLKRANICLATVPHYVFETRMVLSDDGASFRMEDAGYEVNELQSTSKPSDTRSMVSTFSLLEPSTDGRGRLLANSWITHGKMKPGMKTSADSATATSGWTRLPALSGPAKVTYMKESAPYRAVSSEMAKLETGILRAIREQVALREQAEQAEGGLASELNNAADRLDVRIAMNTAKLNAYRAELDELPKVERDYMMVKLRVAMTESRSEKAMNLWLANMIEANSRLISQGVVTLINESE